LYFIRRMYCLLTGMGMDVACVRPRFHPQHHTHTHTQYLPTGFCCCCCGTGVWTQRLHLEPLHQPFFVLGIFKIRSHELFAQAGFKPQSSWSLPLEELGLQVWATNIRLFMHCEQGKQSDSFLPVKTFFKLLLIQMLSSDLEPWGFLVLMLVKVWAGIRWRNFSLLRRS
jgi:hypothetical protein